MDWALDPELLSWEAIWDYGALALLTDCVYSNMADYEYAYIGQCQEDWNNVVLDICFRFS